MDQKPAVSTVLLVTRVSTMSRRMTLLMLNSLCSDGPVHQGNTHHCGLSRTYQSEQHVAQLPSGITWKKPDHTWINRYTLFQGREKPRVIQEWMVEDLTNLSKWSRRPGYEQDPGFISNDIEQISVCTPGRNIQMLILKTEGTPME
jgi:hypothetical protein